MVSGKDIGNCTDCLKIKSLRVVSFILAFCNKGVSLYIKLRLVGQVKLQAQREQGKPV